MNVDQALGRDKRAGPSDAAAVGGSSGKGSKEARFRARAAATRVEIPEKLACRPAYVPVATTLPIAAV